LHFAAGTGGIYPSQLRENEHGAPDSVNTKTNSLGNVDSASVFDQVAILPAPHLVLRLDNGGRVIDFEDAYALDSFASANLQFDLDVHRCLHPDCSEPTCKLCLCLAEALHRAEHQRIVEWELVNGLPDRTIRMHLRRAPDRARTWATLTITDITEGRKVASHLREVNRLLTEMNGRREAGKIEEVNRLDLKLRTLTADLIVAQEGERRRIASELHDGLGQWLAMAKLSLESALHRFGTDSGKKDAERALANLVSGIGEVRSIVRNLRPSALEQFGLVATVELICHQLQLSSPDLEVNCQINGEAGRMSAPLQIAIVRIVQEGTNNAAKHANATRLDVELQFTPTEITLSVTDNGRGFALSEAGTAPDRGLGMTSLRERAAQTAGRLRITSRPGAGTQLQVQWGRKTADPGWRSW
jgi:signal transduction histidine kinase